jgi:DNA-binding NtrC family response regulator
MLKKKDQKIFIVDDDPDYLFQLEFMVKEMGFDVQTASSQKEGEKLLSQKSPNLVILDLMMEKDDSGFILAYQSKKKHPEVPVVITTSASSEAGIQFDLDENNTRQWVHADLMLEKGIRPDQLHREINKLLKI